MYVYDAKTDKELWVEEATPVCGQDFCDTCGDCLACFRENECNKPGGHWWVVYE